MELVSGQTLRERLQQGSLRPADTIEEHILLGALDDLEARQFVQWV